VTDNSLTLFLEKEKGENHVGVAKRRKNCTLIILFPELSKLTNGK